MEQNTRGILSNNRPLTDKVIRNAPILSKNLMAVFIMYLLYIIADLFTNDVIQQYLPAVSTAASIASIVFLVIMAVFFFKLEPTSVHFRKAGIYLLITIVLLTFGVIIVFVPSLLTMAAVAAIAGMISMLVSQYHMIKAYAEVVVDADIRLSRKWDEVWRWYVRCMIALIVGTVLIILVPLLGVIIVLVSTVGVLVVEILIIVYMYKSAALYKNVQKKIIEQIASGK